MPPFRRFIVTVVAASVVFGVVGCGGSTDPTGSTTSAPAGSTSASTVNVQLGEDGSKFFVKVDKASVAAGTVTFAIDNVGTMHHELAIFKTDLPADQLPMNDDGKVDEEKAGMLAEAVYTKPLRGDEDHRIRDGRGVNFTMDLKPGKYVLLCNLAGHYKAGQYIAFTVTGEDTGQTATTATPTTPAAEPVAGTPVGVKLGENGSKFFVKVDKNSVSAGTVTFVIDNVGTMHHELAIFKTDLPADKLPMNDDGKVDEEKAGMLAEAVYTKPLRGDEDHRIRDGRGVNFTMDLKPGKYILLCNLAGHYKAGQYITFTVV